MSEANQELVLLQHLLQEVDLQQFASKIIEELQVSKISHFDYVTAEDLVGIGMGKPAARRLLDHVCKRRKGTLKKKLFHTLVGSNVSKKEVYIEKKIPGPDETPSPNLTCLIKETELKMGIQLGDGSFGIVYQGVWNRANQTTLNVAVKVLKEDMIQQQGIYEDFVREVEAMHSLQHPCLIRLHGVVLTHPLMMVTELAPLGSLLDYLHKQCKHISICSLWQYATQISSGMEYLESRRLIHRDLACRNVFLTSSLQAKLGDFGLLRPLPLDSDCYIMTEQRRVPFPWCAPESLKLRQFSFASDVWMFGITLWEMYTFGEEPWAKLSGREILHRIDKKGERLKDAVATPREMSKLMHRCWLINPAERPRFSEIVSEIARYSPLMVRCRSGEKQQSHSRETTALPIVDLHDGDLVAVIEGRSDCYWWTGQNQRTFDIGMFPRCWTEPDGRRRNGVDISRPLRHSFIHTGHGSSSGPTWGSPAAIDEVYLRNPMEPMDILEMKDPSAKLMKEPRRPSALPVADVTKFKKQFNYVRLSEDAPETTDPTPNEDSLLIDLSSDTPVQELKTGDPLVTLPVPVEPLVAIPSTDRIYANYPSVNPFTSPIPSSSYSNADVSDCSSHYYSEVPIESTYAPLTCYTQAPPLQPVVAINEEFKKKRDEAFSWLSQAIGNMTLNNTTNSSSTSSVTSQQSATVFEKASPSPYGFEDDFSDNLSAAAVSTNSTRPDGSWLESDVVTSSASSWMYSDSNNIDTGWMSTARRMSNSTVQTAHVRPFMVASTSQGDRQVVVNQIKLSTPWACDSDINQALFIHNGNINETIKYLKVDKLYRLGLCSKAICENSLEATNWNLEKAASGLLDK